MCYYLLHRSVIIFKALERVTRTRQHLITGKSATVFDEYIILYILWYFNIIISWYMLQRYTRVGTNIINDKCVCERANDFNIIYFIIIYSTRGRFLPEVRRYTTVVKISRGRVETCCWKTVYYILENLTPQRLVPYIRV